MAEIKYLEHMPAQAKKEHILIRMGYKKGITLLSPDEEAKIDSDIRKASALCSLRGAYKTSKIISINGDILTLETGLAFKSAALRSLLSGCSEILLMAATTGNEVVQARDTEITKGDASYGLVLDATASETADAGLDFIQEFVSASLAKSGRALTRRFSPGYGDLDISAQTYLYNALGASIIGIAVTHRHILVPEKSVMAIAGIKP